MWPFAKCCQIKSIQTFCELYQHWNEHLNLHSLYLFVFFVCCLLWAFRCMSLFLSFPPPDLSDLSAFQSSFLLSSSVFFLLSLLLLSKPRRVILMCTLLFSQLPPASLPLFFSLHLSCLLSAWRQTGKRDRLSICDWPEKTTPSAQAHILSGCYKYDIMLMLKLYFLFHGRTIIWIEKIYS